MPFVLDASITMAWHFQDEASDYAAAVLRRLRDDHAFVPSIWPLEIANVLLVAEKRGRITPAEVAQAVERTLALPIDVYEVDRELALGSLFQLAQIHHLTSYDAAYLELAMRKGLPIATQDTDLLAAARRVGLPDLA